LTDEDEPLEWKKENVHLPLYEYECPEHGRFEVVRKFSDPPLTTCPTCGKKVQKLPSAPAIQFKGTGWYITDYARKSSGEGKDAGKDAGKEGKKDEAGKDTAAKATAAKDTAGAPKESSSKESKATSTKKTGTTGGGSSD